MKKSLCIVLMLLTCMTMTFASGKSEVAADDGVFDVALLINGNLGDKSFHDSANLGMQLVKEQLNATTKVIEVGYDQSKWEPALRDLCDEKHDVVICGTWQMQEILSKVAPDYPEQKFIVYDTSMDYASDTEGKFNNVYSISYKQNDGSYLAGVLAASMSKTGTIGFVGGMDNTVILDFLVGYIQGAKDANPEIKVIPSYVGNFSDAAKAKELTFAQYQMGADIVFACASNASDGVLQASKEKGKLCIGVDSDMAMLYQDTDPEMANLIISSVLKRVDKSILLACTAETEGTLAYGTCAALGINENCIGLADNAIYQGQVSEDVRALVNVYTDKIKNGEIEVTTAFGKTKAEIDEYISIAR